MKGKRFDAHEKHFKKKEAKLIKDINYLKEKYHEICKANMDLEMKNELLEDRNISIKAKYEKLLEYSKLTDEEITEALLRDKSINQLSALFEVIPEFI